MEALRNVIVEEHAKLIQELETKYLHYLNVLLQQKAMIHQQIQKSFYQRLFELNDITKQKHINDKHNTNVINPDIIALPLPVLDYNQYNVEPSTENSNNSTDLSIHTMNTSNTIHSINKNEHANQIKSRVIPKIETDPPPVLITNKTDHEAELFKTQGNKLLKDKKYQKAIVEYTKAIHLDPLNAVYFSNRAAAHTMLRNYKHAAMDARKATDINPNYIKAYMREGVAAYGMNNYQNAYNAYSKAISRIAQNNKNQKMYKQIQERMNLCKAKINPVDSQKSYKLDEFELPYKCAKCSKLFKHQQDLKQHMKEHIRSKQFICSHCRKPFKHKSELKAHFKNVHTVHSTKINKKPFNCGNYSRHDIPAHLAKELNNDAVYECEKCWETFREWNELEKHMATHKGNVGKQQQIVIRQSQHAKYKNDNDENGSDQKSFKCAECVMVFKRNEDLRKHEECHKLTYSFKCRQCCKTFKTKSGLRQHILNHVNKSQYKCSECDKIFKRQTELDRHIRKHFGKGYVYIPDKHM